MPATPVLIYDGDCGICREWVSYWLSLTGQRVVYRPYQSAAQDYPHIPEASFRRSVWLIEPDGHVRSGAAATFRLLGYVRGHGFGWWLYRFLPGFAPLSELAYDFLARRRGLLRGLTRALWGPHPTAPRYERIQWWFLRGLGLIYVCAFVSAGLQITGLVGANGLLPVADLLDRLQGYYGPAAPYHAPAVFWLHAGDRALQTACAAGAAAGLLVILNRLTVPALVVAFVLYLSLFHAGQDFFQFQWDLLLLEAGSLAILLPYWPTVVRWLYRWLLWRFLFMAGAVKLAGGDPVWRGLSALEYHFETQPLPTPLAWYAHHLPESLLATATAATLIIELVLVFLVFAPRRPRMLFGWLVIGFQTAILLTGNYNFFNLLTLLLTLWLFDDAALAALSGGARGLLAREAVTGPGRRLFGGLFLLMIVAAGLHLVGRVTLARPLPGGQAIYRVIQPFMIVNPYGLFADMTTRRPEIIIEGSRDGARWQAYEFRYKPGDPGRAPGWNIPHQPRLDWQLWFAALGEPRQHAWFEPLLRRLLENEPAVTRLLAGNPFPEAGPRFVRARLYRYRFTEPGGRGGPADWWQREAIGLYYPEVTLETLQRRPGRGVPFRRSAPVSRYSPQSVR